MKNRKMNIFQTVLFAGLILGISLCCWLKSPTEYSESERRNLDQLPELSISTLTSGRFMTGFEDYTLDQFPHRDGFRKLKAAINLYIFGKLDNNKYYITDEVYIGKIEYPMKENMLLSAAKKFRYIYQSYLKDNNTNVFLSVIPDKNAFMAGENGKLVMNYTDFFRIMKENCEFAEYIDISDLLSLDDYYATDTHWRQESIKNIADRIAENLGVVLVNDYEEKTLDKDFYGVYYGQSGFSAKPDRIKYLTNDAIENCIVYNLENNTQMTMYDMQKAYGNDPYEMFLSGSVSLIRIENPNATTDKELVVFRDSFGSSLVPLLSTGYKSITIVDIRYLSSAVLGKYIDFANKDVLFIYSTLVLNNSVALK